MAHREQMQFVQSIYAAHPGYFRNCRVLEIGSRKINGSVREFFTNCTYVGIDAAEGEGVDIVTLAHEFPYQFPGTAPFDTIICCEVLEHDPHFDETIRAINSLLIPGGMVVITAAGPARKEHGTPRTTREGDGRDYGPQPDFYRNVTVGRLMHAMQEHTQWQKFHVSYARDRRDIYLVAIAEDRDFVDLVAASRGA